MSTLCGGLDASRLGRWTFGPQPRRCDFSKMDTGCGLCEISLAWRSSTSVFRWTRSSGFTDEASSPHHIREAAPTWPGQTASCGRYRNNGSFAFLPSQPRCDTQNAWARSPMAMLAFLGPGGGRWPATCRGVRKRAATLVCAWKRRFALCRKAQSY